MNPNRGSIRRYSFYLDPSLAMEPALPLFSRQTESNRPRPRLGLVCRECLSTPQSLYTCLHRVKWSVKLKKASASFQGILGGSANLRQARLLREMGKATGLVSRSWPIRPLLIEPRHRHSCDVALAEAEAASKPSPNRRPKPITAPQPPSPQLTRPCPAQDATISSTK
jgi:hypothetical protein